MIFFIACTSPLITLIMAVTIAIINLPIAKAARILSTTGLRASTIKSVKISKTNLIISNTPEKISFNDCQASAKAPDSLTALTRATTKAIIAKIHPIIGML